MMRMGAGRCPDDAVAAALLLFFPDGAWVDLLAEFGLE